jgi:UDP-3-O-[3-hydroxymyristoyl] glucosamine N-acyltransferase
MKRNHGKFLIVAAIPVIVATLPSVTFAACDSSVPPIWDSSVRIPRTASIGGGTVIGPNVTISSYVRIGTCAQIGVDNMGGSISSRAKIGNDVIMSGGSGIGGSASIGAGSTIAGSKVNSNADIGGGSTISGASVVGSYSKVGAGATITGSQLSSYVRMGSGATLTGAYLGYSSDFGDGVTVDNDSRVNRDARVDSNVHIDTNAYIGASAHVCADVHSGMYIAAHSSYGCP